MFLRCKHRFRNGKWHRYYSVVENHRGDGQMHQRQVLYLGEINDSQEAAWQRTLAVFDENAGESRQMSLFPEGRAIPPEEPNASRCGSARSNCAIRAASATAGWSCISAELRLDEFWPPAIIQRRCAWEKVLAILATSCLCDPGSEWRVHRQWYLTTVPHGRSTLKFSFERQRWNHAIKWDGEYLLRA